MTEPWTSPCIPWGQCDPDRRDALYTAWYAGDLSYKLDPVQREIVADIYASHDKVKSSLERVFCLDMSRRAGKDFIMANMAVMTAIKQNRRIRIPYAAPTKEVCHEILVPTFEAIFQDCPPEILPHEIQRGTFQSSARQLTFPWGATIVLVGVDLHPEWLRGTDTYAFFFTEPAFAPSLEHLMTSVLLPQLLTNPDGFGVMGSTPPVTAGHYWSTKMVPDAQLRTMYVKKTVYENPRLNAHQIEGAIVTCGGKDTTKFRREYMCEHVTESTLAYIPEFREAKEKIVQDMGDPPPFADTYSVIDPGFAHATGAVFGYLDFEQDLFVVQGCFKTQGLNSSEVARRINAREWQLWGRAPIKPDKWSAEAWGDELENIRALFYPDLPIPSQPWGAWNSGSMRYSTYKRISDTDARLIADLSQEHSLTFSPTDKAGVEVNVNNLRLNVQRTRYRIHPRCVELITDLEQAVWNKGKSKLAEAAGGHHYDAVKALEYLNRNIAWTRNPYPPTLVDTYSNHVPRGPGRARKTAGALMKAFGRKR